MDIKKLQALVVDALEDIKAQDILLYDTTHMTSLFDSIAIASGTSNRQTKALAASVRDKVKSNGGQVVSMEGEETGEWVLVDLGDMVVHIMQPAIRAYYRLEEIWGEKPVKMPVCKSAAKTAAKTTVAKKAPAKAATKTATKAPAKTAAKTAVAKKAPAKKAAAKKVATKAESASPARKTPVRAAKSKSD